MKLEPGQVVSGTLRLVRKIAEGGMGSVWVAEHLVLGTEVAVKFMSPQWSLFPGAAARFLREARITAKIDSPHVVRVLDCRMTESDEPYLVLELLRGENLEQRIRRHGALPILDVLAVVTQTSDAIAQAHQSGVVHRDIKPENVFLEAGSQVSVKLLDFGVAKPKNRDECLDVDRLPAGTVQYMSPEHMFDPETTDERSDLFSLAAVAYFALTRRPPFDAESLEGLYFAIDGGAFTRPSEHRPELPPAVDAWFAKALAHAPEKRFASAHEMAAAFQAAVFAPRNRSVLRGADGVVFEELATGPISLSSVPGVPAALPRLRRRHAKKAATAALVVATAASIFAWHDGPKLREATAAAATATADAAGAVETPEFGPVDPLGSDDQPTVAPLRSARLSVPFTAGPRPRTTSGAQNAGNR